MCFNEVYQVGDRIGLTTYDDFCSKCGGDLPRLEGMMTTFEGHQVRDEIYGDLFTLDNPRTCPVCGGNIVWFIIPCGGDSVAAQLFQAAPVTVER